MPHPGRLLCSFVLAAAFSFSALEAHAQQPLPQLTLSDSTQFPDNLVRYGCGSTYKVSDIPAPWQPNGQVTYKYWQIDTKSGIPSDPRVATGGSSWSTIKGTPGTFQIFGLVPVATQQDPNHPIQQTGTVKTNILTVTVLPPDRIELPGPVNVDWVVGQTPNGRIVGYRAGPVQLGFQVSCNGFPPNSLPNATPLEDIYNGRSFAADIRNSFKKPIEFGGIQGNNIMVEKFIQTGKTDLFPRFDPANPAPYPKDYVFITYKQALYLRIPDLNSDDKDFPLLPSFIFTQSSSNGAATPTTITVK